MVSCVENRFFLNFLLDIISSATLKTSSLCFVLFLPQPLAVTTGVLRTDRAHDTFLVCPSSPPLSLSTTSSQDCCYLTSTYAIPSDAPTMYASTVPFASCTPVSATTNSLGYGASSVTQNNPLYRSYDEVNGSVEDMRGSNPDRDSLCSRGVDGMEADVDSSDGDYDNSCDAISEHNASEDCAGDSYLSRLGTHSLQDHSNTQMEVKSIPLRMKSTKPLGRKYSSGFSSNSDFSDEGDQFADYDEVYDPETAQFAAQLSKSIWEKLMSPKQIQEENMHQKLKQGSSTLPAMSTAPKPGPRSLLVRTLTMPLRYAAQHRHSLTKVFSRSQPSTPELPRRNQVARSYVRPEQIGRGLGATSLGMENQRLTDNMAHGFRESQKKKKSPLEVKSPSGKPPKVPLPHHRPVTRKASSLGRQASFRNPFPTQAVKSPPPNVLDSWPSQPCNNPILEPCVTCARNVAANIQHASIWAEVENLPRGYLDNVEENKMVEYKRKPTREDCKLQ